MAGEKMKHLYIIPLCYVIAGCSSLYVGEPFIPDEPVLDEEIFGKYFRLNREQMQHLDIDDYMLVDKLPIVPSEKLLNTDHRRAYYVFGGPHSSGAWGGKLWWYFCALDHKSDKYIFLDVEIVLYDPMKPSKTVEPYGEETIKEITLKYFVRNKDEVKIVKTEMELKLLNPIPQGETVPRRGSD